MNYILQIGEGNFLRAFAEEYAQNCNDYKVVICQPRTNTKVINALKNQGCEYDIILRGRYNGEIIDKREHISCVERCIDTVGEYDRLRELFCSESLKIVISNTTEAGICFKADDIIANSPDVSFPGKVTVLLYERYKKGAKPLVFMPVELIEDNASELERCIISYADLWELESEFKDYIKSCHFCNTLVDRIVTGKVDGDIDPCAVACEPYKSWVVQADSTAREIIPFDGITFTDNLSLFRTRKVRILNGAHTMSVLAGYMAGFDIVRDMVSDELFSKYILLGLDEIKSTLCIDCDDFANAVLERFNNPFIDHKLLDISLNSISKFRVRCLDTITDYYDKNKYLPKVLTFSLAALIAFYLKLSDRDYEIRDNDDVVSFFSSKPDVSEILSNESFWGRDLTEIDEFEKTVSKHLDIIKKDGIINAVRGVVDEFNY